MSKPINISIPEELYDKLQNYKHLINISKVCQEAIENIISEVEEFKEWRKTRS